MYVLGETDPSFLEEVWALYGIGMLVLILRFAIRLRTVGIKGFQGDDVFALLLIVCYTLDAVTVHNVYYMSTNVEGSVIQKDRPLLQGEIDQLTEGSKQQLVAWYSYSALVWCLKGTMIFFFKRMTLGLSYQRLVNYIGYACVIAYTAVVLTITFGCWPVHHNYQVIPDPGVKCTLKPQNFIVMTALNVLTDAAILYVPMPLLWALQVPLRQKLGIGVLLSTGVFVISAAIIRIVSTLSANPSALTINRWGVRETIVGIVAVNAPILPPLFKRSFWTRGPFQIQSKPGSDGGLIGSNGTGRGAGGNSQIEGPYQLQPSVHSSEHIRATRGSLNSSEENIIIKDVENNAQKRGKDGKVLIETTYEVRSDKIQGDAEQQQATRWYTGAYAEAVAFDSSNGSSKTQV